MKACSVPNTLVRNTPYVAALFETVKLRVMSGRFSSRMLGSRAQFIASFKNVGQDTIDVGDQPRDVLAREYERVAPGGW